MQNEIVWAQGIAIKIKEKMRIVAKRNRSNIPYTTIDGRYDDWTDKDICWWTNGFYGGMMWQMYYATGDSMYQTIAVELEEKLDRNLMNHRGMDHDSGFRWLTTSGAHFRFDNDEKAYNRTLLAADNLAGRFNPIGGFIRAWNDDGNGSFAGRVIIDCMMNLPLLYWASEQLKDPRYAQIAQIHAQTTLKYFIRDDGSVNHIVDFDPYTGEFIASRGGQGYGEGSSWTRGQAWAIYGFSLSYRHTKERCYLEAAKKVATYFISNIPDNGCIVVDFRQPSEYEWEDSSAAAIAACGMLELCHHLEEKEKEPYFQAAMKLLYWLGNHRSNWSTETDNIIEKCSAAFHDSSHEFAIIYGDYYFIEAIWKLTKEELFIW